MRSLARVLLVLSAFAVPSSAGATADDHFAQLGVPFGAPMEDVKAQFRKLARQYHPDKNKNNDSTASEKFLRISEAHAILTDEAKRAEARAASAPARLPRPPPAARSRWSACFSSGAVAALVASADRGGRVYALQTCVAPIARADGGMGGMGTGEHMRGGVSLVLWFSLGDRTARGFFSLVREGARERRCGSLRSARFLTFTPCASRARPRWSLRCAFFARGASVAV